MEFEITSDTRNELLGRRELRFILTYDGATPSRKEIRGKLCALNNINENLVVLDSLRTGYGRMQLNGFMRIYDTEEGRQRTERSYLMERGMPKKEEEEA